MSTFVGLFYAEVSLTIMVSDYLEYNIIYFIPFIHFWYVLYTIMGFSDILNVPHEICQPLQKLQGNP